MGIANRRVSNISGASVRKVAREMGRAETGIVHAVRKKITYTIRSLPKSQARHFTFRFIILQRVEDEDGARATPARARIPVPPWHTELVEQTAICNSKLLSIVSRPPSAPSPSDSSHCRQMFFPRLLFQYLPSQEWSWPPKSRSLSVSSATDWIVLHRRSSNNCARSSRTDPIVTSSCWRIS